MIKDFSYRNIRGWSFQGMKLKGADFSHADIRGTNFKDAVLVGADFSHAKAGLRYRSVLLLFFVIIALSFVSSKFIQFSGKCQMDLIHFIHWTFFLKGHRYDYPYQIFLFIIIFILIIFIFLIWGNRKKKFFQYLKSMAWFINLIWLMVFVFCPENIDPLFVIYMAFWAFFAAGTGFLSVLVATIIFLTRSFAITIAGLFGGSLIIFYAFYGTYYGSLQPASNGSLAVCSVMVTGLLFLSLFIARQVLNGDKQFAKLRKLGALIASLGGTDFRGADLRNSNFNCAVLKGARFNKSTRISLKTFSNAKQTKLASGLE